MSASNLENSGLSQHKHVFFLSWFSQFLMYSCASPSLAVPHRTSQIYLASGPISRVSHAECALGDAILYQMRTFSYFQCLHPSRALPFLSCPPREPMCAYPRTPSGLLRSGRSGWHINSHLLRSETKTCLLLPAPLCLHPDTQAGPHKARALKAHWIHPCCHSVSPLLGGLWSELSPVGLPAPSALCRTSSILSTAESSNVVFPGSRGNFPGSVIPASPDLFHSRRHSCWPGFALLSGTT